MLGPDPLGARRRHDQAAELGLLDLHHPWGPGDDSATRPPAESDGRGEQQALTGLPHKYPGDTDRALKASPPGGLPAGLDRPPQPRPRRGLLVARPSSTTATTIIPQTGLRYAKTALTQPAASDMPVQVGRGNVRPTSGPHGIRGLSDPGRSASVVAESGGAHHRQHFRWPSVLP